MLPYLTIISWVFSALGLNTHGFLLDPLIPPKVFTKCGGGSIIRLPHLLT